MDSDNVDLLLLLVMSISAIAVAVELDGKKSRQGVLERRRHSLDFDFSLAKAEGDFETKFKLPSAAFTAFASFLTKYIEKNEIKSRNRTGIQQCHPVQENEFRPRSQIEFE